MENCEIRTLLPVKSTDGRWVYPTEVVPDEDGSEGEIIENCPSEDVEDSEEEDHSPAKDEKEEEEDTVVSDNFVQRYAFQQQLLKQLKTKIAMLGSSVTEDPENNMRALKELLLMLVRKPRTKMLVTEKKLLLLSLLHVFSDILPGYMIRSPLQEQQQQDNKKVKLKKETRKLMANETTMLQLYKKYLDHLQKLTHEMKRKRLEVSAQGRAQREIGLVAAKCLSELLVSRYYFNFNETVIGIVVRLACSRDAELQRICCEGIKNLYQTDKLGDASLKAVKHTVKVIKERKFSVPTELVRTFLSLQLKEVKPPNLEKANMNKVRKELEKMSKKERWHRKRMRDLTQEMKEAEAQESQDNKSKFQTVMLKKVFWVYFHILKDSMKKSLVTPVLEGLSHFAYLINLEFFDDVTSILSMLLKTENLRNIEQLYCMQTVFTILAGQNQSLNIDPQRLYTCLYNIFVELHSSDTEEFFAVLKCVHLMLIKRKKNITYNRMLAFIKRLSTMSIHMPLHLTLSALLMVRLMMMNTTNSDILLDTESTVGSGVYLPELEDPEYCNPVSTALWELCLLIKSYNPVARDLARHIIHGCPVQGRMQLSEKLKRYYPDEALNLFSDVVLKHKIEPELCKIPTKKLCVRRSVNMPKAIRDLDSYVPWEDVKDIDFLK